MLKGRTSSSPGGEKRQNMEHQQETVSIEQTSRLNQKQHSLPASPISKSCPLNPLAAIETTRLTQYDLGLSPGR